MNRSPEQVVERYFELWKQQDVDGLKEIFALDAKYVVHPFGVEEYVGLKEIQAYWRANPVAKQVSPKPRILSRAITENTCFVEWETTYATHAGDEKRVRGMMVMELRNGLIQELREHYSSRAS